MNVSEKGASDTLPAFALHTGRMFERHTVGRHAELLDFHALLAGCEPASDGRFDRKIVFVEQAQSHFSGGGIPYGETRNLLRRGACRIFDQFISLKCTENFHDFTRRLQLSCLFVEKTPESELAVPEQRPECSHVETSLHELHHHFGLDERALIGRETGTCGFFSGTDVPFETGQLDMRHAVAGRDLAEPFDFAGIRIAQKYSAGRFCEPFVP